MLTAFMDASSFSGAEHNTTLAHRDADGGGVHPIGSE